MADAELEKDLEQMPSHEANALNSEGSKGHKAANQVQRLVGQTRLIATIPAFGLVFCAFVLVVATTIRAVEVTLEFIGGELALTSLTIDYVEFTDMYLLGVVLFMTALGLTVLFITEKIPLPAWLEFHDFDDLKERLVSVIVVMLGVHFLGKVLKGADGIELLWLGIGICVVVIALTAFTSAIFKRK